MASSRIPVVRNQAYKPHGLKSYVYALNKYGIAPTQPSMYSRDTAQSKLLMKQQDDGTHRPVDATDQMNDAFYTCPITVGTPPQKMNVNFDSGSSDCWLWSTLLDDNVQTAGAQQKIAIFDPEASSTFKTAAGSTWQIKYGDGSGASGKVGFDTLKVGDVTVEKQGIEVANDISESFQQQGGTSGLMGLAFGNINTVQPTPVKTPVENMIAQKDITNPIWSVYLGSVKDLTDPDKGKSFYTFGSYDEEVVKASGQEIAWTPIDSKEGFWMFDSDAATINGEKLALDGNRAMADTGTTLMLCSDTFCQALYKAIDGAKYDKQQGGWIIPGKDVDKRPDVKVKIGNAMITIEKEQLGWADLEDGSGYVFGAIQSRGSNPFDIWGDTFLICCYAIFDVGQKRLGVVQRADPTPAGQ